jgi:hypothetical protein
MFTKGGIMTLITEPYSTIRTYKRAVGNPSFVWQNTYELDWTQGETPGTSNAWLTILEGMLEAERQLHTANVEFVKAVGSSWSPLPPGPQQYDPEEFCVYLPDEPSLGTRTVSGDPLPRHCALYVKKEVTFGHTGKLFYRGVLSEADIQSTSALDLRIPTASLSVLQQLVTAMMADMSVVIEAHMGFHAMIRLPYPDADPESRVVQGFVASGLSINKPNHAYFDRG